MAKVLRPIGHEDRLSIVDHLDELRSRLIICGIALAIAFAACFWQNHALLKILNRALPETQRNSANHISGLTRDQVNASHDLAALANDFGRLANSATLSQPDKDLLAQASKDAAATA